jgi:uncharacterized protein (DUF58 family)
VWAKQDRFYVKQYEEDTNLRSAMLVDVSGSMRYGRGPLNKFEYASTLAVSLAYLLLRQQDAVGCLAFDETVRSRVALHTKRSHLNSIIQALSVTDPGRKTDMLSILRGAVETYPRRGLMILISDLLVERDALFAGLRLLRQMGHDVVVLHIMDDDELDFPFNGATRFEGLELPANLNCNPRALREGYLEAVGKFLHDVRHGCARQGVDYTLIRTSQPMDVALTAYLNHRLAVQTRN